MKNAITILLIFILTVSCNRQKIPEPEHIPYNISDYNGIYKLDSIGKEFILQMNDSTFSYNVTEEDAIGLKNIENASLSISEFTNTPAISIKFDKIGTTKVHKLTKNSTGKQLAIIFNNKLLICPMIQGEISNGRMEINSNISMQEAVNIVAYINKNK